MECRSEICFLKQSFTKYVEINLQNQVKYDFFGKLNT